MIKQQCIKELPGKAGQKQKLFMLATKLFSLEEIYLLHLLL